MTKKLSDFSRRTENSMLAYDVIDDIHGHLD